MFTIKKLLDIKLKSRPTQTKEIKNQEIKKSYSELTESELTCSGNVKKASKYVQKMALLHLVGKTKK